MKARGITARAGDVIPYVFCLGDSGESSKTAQADKAKHPDEVRRESDKFKIGRCIIRLLCDISHLYSRL